MCRRVTTAFTSSHFQSLQTAQLQQTSTHIADDPALDCLLIPPHHANIKTPVRQPKQLCLRHHRPNTNPNLTTKTSTTMPSQTSSSGSSGSSGQGYSVTGSGTNSQVCCLFASRAFDLNGKHGSRLPILPRHLCNTTTPELSLNSPPTGQPLLQPRLRFLCQQPELVPLLQLGR